LKARPSAVLLNGKPLEEAAAGEGYSWSPLGKGGVLSVRRKNGNRVIVVE
jgi:hypothetical protein